MLDRFYALAGALTGFTLIALSSLALSPTLASASEADTLMGRLAAKQTHGWKDNDLPAVQLERKLNRGQRIYVTCSIVADLGVRLARRNGIPARHVSTVTNRAFNGHDDGHALMEIKVGGKWVLYDLDANVVAVDKHGKRIGLAAQVKAGHDRKWRKIADDRLWDTREIPGERVAMTAYLKDAFVNSAAWYDRAFGVALVETSPGHYAYHGTGRHSPRIEAVWPGHYHWVNAQTWRQISR